MALDRTFSEQARLLVTVLPQVARQTCFALIDADKRFLLAVKKGEADWQAFAYPQARSLPAIQWKLHNLARLSADKRRAAAGKLENFLFGN